MKQVAATIVYSSPTGFAAAFESLAGQRLVGLLARTWHQR